MNFPIKKYKEGKTFFYAPDLDKYGIPQNAPAFYNPNMKFNRDCSLIAIQTYQKLLNKNIIICDPLSGVGIRGLRYVNELNGVNFVFVNDYNKNAYELILRNIKLLKNNLIIKAFNKEANNFLNDFSILPKVLDIIDIDPFGSPTCFIDTAVRALKKRGLIMLTATDMRILCGIQPKVCARKYGGYSLKTNYCHEIAIRLLLGCLMKIANRFNFYIHPLMSFTQIHYIRTIVELIKNKKEISKNLKDFGYISHCFKCNGRLIFKELDIKIPKTCPFCGSKLISIAGPLWLGKIQDKNFLSNSLEIIKNIELTNKKKIELFFSTLLAESEMPPTYYNIHKICKNIKISAPKLESIINKLHESNFIASRTHFCPICIKTDANINLIIKTIKDLKT
ncbi:MAG: tRNA (guanine(10)-N(2))-dimethyltransferase [Candidatus Helarchaeota archaeon]